MVQSRGPGGNPRCRSRGSQRTAGRRRLPLAAAGRAPSPCGITYRDRIAECNDADLGRYVPWHADGRRAGFVRADRCGWLLQQAGFVADTDGRLLLLGDDFDARSRHLAALAHQLAGSGQIGPLRGESYAVAEDLHAAPLARLDRAAVPWFGVRPFGVHCNGYVRAADGIRLWVAERARDKPSFPGRWDNLAAGGQPFGLGLRDNLQKECAEEAGLPPALAATATPQGRITYVAEDAVGLKPDTLFCFDLELPADFVPRNRDGEVARFFLLPVAEVAAAVRDSRRFKPNCSLVVLDFLLRHGLLDDELAAVERDALTTALRTPLP